MLASTLTGYLIGTGTTVAVVVIGAVIQKRLAFRLARDVRTDERREDAVNTVVDFAHEIRRLAERQLDFHRDNPALPIQGVIMTPLGDWAGKFDVQWHDHLSQAVDEPTRIAYDPMRRDWETTHAALQANPASPPPEFWTSLVALESSAASLLAWARSQRDREFGVRRKRWRKA